MQATGSFTYTRRGLALSALVSAIGTLVPAAAVLAGTAPLANLGVEAASQARTSSSSTAVTALSAEAGASTMSQPSSDTSVRPFQFHATDESLADLRRRIEATKWPSQELVPDA